MISPWAYMGATMERLVDSKRSDIPSFELQAVALLVILLYIQTRKVFVQAHKMQSLYLSNFVSVNRALWEAVTYMASKVCCWDRTNPVDN